MRLKKSMDSPYGRKTFCVSKSNSQIAGDLNISEATVKAHIHNLLSKMDAASRVEVILTVQKKVMGTTTE